jgi:hypothetical protein
MRRAFTTTIAAALSAATLLSGTALGSPPRDADQRACERAWKAAFGVEAPPNCLKQAVAMRGTGAP